MDFRQCFTTLSLKRFQQFGQIFIDISQKFPSHFLIGFAVRNQRRRKNKAF